MSKLSYQTFGTVREQIGLIKRLIIQLMAGSNIIKLFANIVCYCKGDVVFTFSKGSLSESYRSWQFALYLHED